MSRGFLLQWPANLSDDVFAAINPLIRRKLIETTVFEGKWKRHYPDASPGAVQLTMNVSSDALVLMKDGYESWSH